MNTSTWKTRNSTERLPAPPTHYSSIFLFLHPSIPSIPSLPSSDIYFHWQPFSQSFIEISFAIKFLRLFIKLTSTSEPHQPLQPTDASFTRIVHLNSLTIKPSSSNSPDISFHTIVHSFIHSPFHLSIHASIINPFIPHPPIHPSYILPPFIFPFTYHFPFLLRLLHLPFV